MFVATCVYLSIWLWLRACVCVHSLAHDGYQPARNLPTTWIVASMAEVLVSMLAHLTGLCVKQQRQHQQLLCMLVITTGALTSPSPSPPLHHDS